MNCIDSSWFDWKMACIFASFCGSSREKWKMIFKANNNVKTDAENENLPAQYIAIWERKKAILLTEMDS